MKTYRECTKEPYSFLIIDTTLSSTNPLKFRKNLFDTLQKMIVTDQIKTLDRKIKQNEEQYDLDREAAKISALSSNNLDKYEYLTGEDLGLQPSTAEKAKFEYSPLGKIFNKGLSKEDEKEGLLEKLKNIEDKNDKQLQVIKDQGGKQLEQLKNIYKSKTLEVIDKISKKMMKQINYCLNLKKQIRHLRMQILFVQKLIIKLNMTLIVFLFH